MYQIQMKENGQWVTLGGKFADPGQKIAEFQNHYMVRSTPKRKDSNLVCTREFRAVRIGGEPARAPKQSRKPARRGTTIGQLIAVAALLAGPEAVFNTLAGIIAPPSPQP